MCRINFQALPAPIPPTLSQSSNEITHFAVVQLLPLVGENGPDDCTSVLNDHLPWLYLLGAVEAQTMDVRLEHTDVVFVGLLEITVTHRHGEVRGRLHPGGEREGKREGGEGREGERVKERGRVREGRIEGG